MNVLLTGAGFSHNFGAIHAGATETGDGLLKVNSKTGETLIIAGPHVDGNGAFMPLSNKTGENTSNCT